MSQVGYMNARPIIPGPLTASYREGTATTAASQGVVGELERVCLGMNNSVELLASIRNRLLNLAVRLGGSLPSEPKPAMNTPELHPESPLVERLNDAQRQQSNLHSDICSIFERLGV